MRSTSTSSFGALTETSGTPACPGARQYVVAAGEADLGRAVADVDLVIGGFQQHFASGGGQALAQHHRVALAVAQAVDADLLALPVTAPRRPR